MWWYFVKLNETEKTVIYSYGYESKETTGQFEYDKVRKKATVIKYAINHSENIDIQYPAFQLVQEYGNLNEKMIAYG
jgi:hypothetical protein